MNKIRVVLCDDIEEIRGYFKKIIEKSDDVEVVGTAASGEEAVKVVKAKKPDIVLLDIQMETTTSGIDAARKICSEMKDTKVLMLTIHDDDDLIREAYIAGAVDYILKESEAENVLDTIRSAYKNDNFIGPYLAQKIRKELIITKKKDISIMFLINKISTLTKSERNLMKYLCAGYKRREISEMMFLSEETIKMHIHHLLKKLGFANTKEMVKFFRDVGLFEYFDM